MKITDAMVLVEQGRQAGRVIGLQDALLRMGTRHFGPPDESTRAAVEGTISRERLEQLVEHILDYTDWEALLSS